MDGEGTPQPSIEDVQNEPNMATDHTDHSHAPPDIPSTSSPDHDVTPRTQPAVDETHIDTSFQPDQESNYALQSKTSFDNMSDAPVSSADVAAPVETVPSVMHQLNLGTSLLTKSGNNRTTKDEDAAIQREILKRWTARITSTPASGAPAQSMDGLNDFELPEVDDAPPPSSKFRKTTTIEDGAFKKIKQAYERKRRANTMSIEEEIEFMKIEAREKARKRKQDADHEYDHEPSPELEDDESAMFVQSDDARAIFSDDDDEESEPAPKRGRKKGKRPAESDLESEMTGTTMDSRPRKKAKPVGSGAKKSSSTVAGHDYTNEDFDRTLNNSANRRNMPPPATRPRRPAGSKAKNGPKKSGPKKKGPEMTNVNSVFGSNVFEDAAQTARLREQPSFAPTTKRAVALKNLVAHIPEEDQQAATSDKRALDKACSKFTGRGSVRPAKDGSGNWTVKGMKTSLKHYQVLGVAFMRERENGEEPRGGILADQMGLGKTISMLANIVNGKPDRSIKNRATLIVAAPALVTQWKAEIDKHCCNDREDRKHGLGNILRYHTGSRLDAGVATVNILAECDIVLTTYHEVAKSYPKAEVPSELTTAAQKDAWWRQHFEDAKGILHRVRFHRIVCDEAQAIKNHKGHTSMAVRAINAKHHWAITGTPIMNSIKEFYPYFKFLREPNTGSYKIFKENFCTPDDPDGIEKLNVFLRKIMIRRTHVDTLFNARLLDLPPPEERTLWLDFNEIERNIYEIVKSRMIARINSFSRTEGGLEKQYSHVWTMILRLRQLCSHILLIQGVILDILEREDFEKLNKIMENEDEIGDDSAATLLNLRHVLANSEPSKETRAGLGDAVLTSSETKKSSIIDIDITREQDAMGGKHATAYRFRKYMDDLVESKQWVAINDRMRCSACRQPPHQPKVTSCFHIHCTKCLEDMQHFAARRGHDQARCNDCGTQYTSVEDVDIDRWESSRSSGSPSVDGDGPSGGKGKGKKKCTRKEGDISDWIGLKGEILPSAKTAACKAQVMNWLEESQDNKIIIYTQFIPVVRILAKVCQTEGWDFVKYTGEQSHETREKAIEDFANPEKDVKIMLASLKCGGLGLNLTMASKVICMDPWWNMATEQQAFCRVFRIGQTKETEMTRFVINNTIDAAMMAVKERKQLEIDAVMDGQSNKKLSVTDLIRLFGNKVGEDQDGKPFIFAEPEEDPEQLHREDESENEDNDMGNEF